jgi:hypothetical protein
MAPRDLYRRSMVGLVLTVTSTFALTASAAIVTPRDEPDCEPARTNESDDEE